MKTKLTIVTIALLALLSTLNSQLSTCLASPLGTAFTYQGKLTDGGPSANGLYDLEFTLYDAATNGSHVAGPRIVSPVGVTNGLFTTTIDFGVGVFTGEARWLGIAVRTNGVGGFATFPARQLLTPAPAALYAPQAGSAATVASNSVTAQGLSTPTPPAAGQVLAFNGTNLVWASATGAAVSNAWLLGGNAGTTPGLNFLGTTDNQPLEFKVNGQCALRLEPTLTNGTINLIAGSPCNYVAPGVIGAVIGGGGVSNWYGFPDSTNRVASDWATIGGGIANGIGTNSQSATIAGGDRNKVGGSDYACTIGGGAGNTIEQNATRSTVAGGTMNVIQTSADAATIAGGCWNLIEVGGLSSTIGGGYTNVVRFYSESATIAGGSWNRVASFSDGATVSGGVSNLVGGTGSAIGGGLGNMIQTNASHSTIAGGRDNTIETNALRATISGGEGNTIGAWAGHATISGGSGNTIVGDANYASIGGGVDNKVQLNAMFSTIGGGGGNLIGTNTGGATISGGRYNEVHPEAYDATIGGGLENSIRDNASLSLIAGGYANEIQSNVGSATISGGWGNVIQIGAENATIGGGLQNVAVGAKTCIGGGVDNMVGGDYSTIAGGWTNTTSGYAATVGGGQYNVASNSFATIGGGNQNVASLYGTVPGGALNHATGDFSFAAGRRAKAMGGGSFVWGDSTDADVAAWGTNQFVVRATGGYFLYSGVAPSAGVTLSPGSGAWSNMSDRNAKTNAAPVDARAVLDKVAALPVATWNYKAQDPSVRHIGPVAQDFHAAFGVGDSDKTISTVDADGVALAAIQGLNQKVEAAVKEKDVRIAELERRLAALEQLVNGSTK